VVTARRFAQDQYVARDTTWNLELESVNQPAANDKRVGLVVVITVTANGLA
jgi:hypothetical protein